MGCFHPLHGWQRADGTVTFKAVPDAKREIKLACGQCIGCRLDKARSWAARCMCEAQMHKRNSFLTLTYAPEHLPERGSLHYPDYQKFMKRMRRDGIQCRFFMVGEYGGVTNRPHYHALIFGYDFAADRIHWRTAKNGERVYISKSLARYWPLGNHEIGSVNFQSAAYVARYCLKKVGGDPAELHYSRVDPGTGELVRVEPEFARMSLKPGIGRSWLEKYKKDVLTNDGIVLPGGKKISTPEYFRNILAEENPEQFEEMAFQRYMRSQRFLDQNTPERLSVREAVQTAKAKQKERGL